MKSTTILALLIPLCACRVDSGSVDYAATADAIALYRQDVLDVLYLASPEEQVRVREIASAIQRVEDALRAADTGTASSAAARAIDIADVLLRELEPESDLRFYLALAKIALRHVQYGDVGSVARPDEAASVTPK